MQTIPLIFELYKCFMPNLLVYFACSTLVQQGSFDVFIWKPIQNKFQNNAAE